jgi:hypothetical protein
MDSNCNRNPLLYSSESCVLGSGRIVAQMPRLIFVPLLGVEAKRCVLQQPCASEAASIGCKNR